MTNRVLWQLLTDYMKRCEREGVEPKHIENRDLQVHLLEETDFDFYIPAFNSLSNGKRQSITLQRQMQVRSRASPNR